MAPWFSRMAAVRPASAATAGNDVTAEHTVCNTDCSALNVKSSTGDVGLKVIVDQAIDDAQTAAQVQDAAAANACSL